MKNILKTTMQAATVCSLLPFGTAEAHATEERPNVLMFVVDDWGRQDMSFMGSRLYETPNVDRLAEISTFFNQGYVAYPRSGPSRYALMTGLHCARPQARSRDDNRKVSADSYCIAMPFQRAGYETFIIGKWHLNDGAITPAEKGFDINIGAGKAGSTSSYFAPFNKAGVTNPDKVIHGMDDARPGEYLTDYMTRKTVDYIRTAAEKEDPFFAVCSFYAVHTPIQAPDSLEDRYREKIRRMGLGEEPFMQQEAGVCKTQQDHPVYAAMIESVDRGIGQIVETLKQTGEYDNTIIVLISDHGGLSNRGAHNRRELATSNLPLKAGKGHLYEGGVRVPYMIHLPRQTRGRRSDVPVVSYDLLPTLTDLCGVGVDPETTLDGRSLRPLLYGRHDAGLEHRDLYWHKASQRPNSTGDYVSTAVRSGRYKLIDFYLQNRIELYDLERDPGEQHDLSAEKPEVVERLLSKIKTWRKDMKVLMADPETMNHDDQKPQHPQHRK